MHRWPWHQQYYIHKLSCAVISRSPYDVQLQLKKIYNKLEISTSWIIIYLFPWIYSPELQYAILVKTARFKRCLHGWIKICKRTYASNTIKHVSFHCLPPRVKLSRRIFQLHALISAYSKSVCWIEWPRIVGCAAITMLMGGCFLIVILNILSFDKFTFRRFILHIEFNDNNE